MMNTDLVGIDESPTNIKQIEARSAILLNNKSTTCRKESTMWLLEHMFRPLIARDYNGYELLLLSGNARPVWERKKKELKSQSQPDFSVLSPNEESSTVISSTIQNTPSEMYIITPRTRVLSVTKEHSIVFMIDLSSSLATIETSTGKVIIGSTFSVLENIIQGLVKPFSLNVSETGSPIILEYIIRITVIAECSQFGSNMNVIPILAEYPTMRVLLQNIHITSANVNTVLKTLKELIDHFKRDLGRFRKSLKEKRSKLGYELDVREDHVQSVTETVETNYRKSGSGQKKTKPQHKRNRSLSKQPNKKNDPNSNSPTTAKKSSTSNNNHHHHHHHHKPSTSDYSAGPIRRSNIKDKKDVWGVGKTGSSLDYILRAGIFALDLLPKHSQSSLILLTDGVVKSSIQDESIVSHLIAENISCNVIHIGQDKSFFPGLNFGFVPDNEILEYLTSATYGVFSYADQCPPIVSEDSDSLMPPNIYHHRYMLKEIYLDPISSRKSKESNANSQNKVNENEASDTNTPRSHVEHRAFPWDPLSILIPEDIVPLKYKEYFLPTECSHFIKARLRQGFVLQSISLFDEPKAGNKINKQFSMETFQHKHNIVLMFILRWKPNISIHYNIKATWNSSMKYHPSTDKLVHIPEESESFDYDTIFNRIRAPKADIFIRSSSSFSHLLRNWDAFQRRSQMMAVQGGSATFALAGTPAYIKASKLRRFLEKLAETDTMLKQLVQFNIAEKSQPSDMIGDTMSTELNYIQKFTSHWAKVERSEFRVFNRCWYDQAFFNLIIGETLSPTLLANFPEYHEETVIKQKRMFMLDNYDVDDITNVMHYIILKLEKWATFTSEDQQVYIKILNVGEASSILKLHPMENNKRPAPITNQSGIKRHIVPQFCELRFFKETDRAICVKVMFFNTDNQYRQFVLDELQNLLKTNSTNGQSQTLASLEVKNALSPVNNYEDNYYFDTNSTVAVTKRPFSSLLMRDSSHYLPPYSPDEPSKYVAINQSNSKTLWYINPALLLTGEFIVQNYLNQYTWHWDAQELFAEKHISNRYIMPILNLAFDHISVVRLEQKWSLISSNKSFAHFYKEIEYDNNQCVYSAQYFIWKDSQKKRVTTELWIEPVTDKTNLKKMDALRLEIFEADRYILSQLITFDIMYMIGQNATVSVADILIHQMEIEDEARGTTKWMQRASLFNLSSVLKLGSFLYALYPLPNYNRHYYPEGNDVAALDQIQQIQQQQLQQQQQQQQQQQINDVTETSNSRRKNGVAHNAIIGTGSRTRTVSRISPGGSPHHSKTPTTVWHSDKCTHCTCPRPDKLFCNQKDSISKLKPVLRDIALLHYYVEQSLSSVTDRNMSLDMISGDDFWSTILKQVLKSPEMTNLKSTLYVTQNFKDLHCFIKIFDPAVFIVLLLPQLDSIVKGLYKLENVTSNEIEKYAYNQMGLLMFECQRQDTVSSYGNTLKVNQVKVHPIDALSSKDWLESLRSTLRPNLTRGYFASSQMNTPLSDRTLRLMQDVAQVYSRSFVKSIFTCLLHGRAVDSEDFEKVLEICDESNLDIDLTGYLNVQTLLKKRYQTSEEELISANQRFISVLSHYFEPVIISNSKWSNMYCYRPPFAKVGQKLGLSLATGEKPSNLADVVVCAQNPLFVRLDCTLRTPSKTGNGFNEVTFPLKNLPVSYDTELDDGSFYNFEPELIGTKYSPVDSADGTTATLHLVCMTLPQSESDPPNALFSHNASCPADSPVHQQTSFLDVDKVHRARLPSLSQDKQDALVETEARLTWLFTEEIMHGLLRSGPITQNVIRYIEAQLKKKNPFVDFPTTMFIPLAFVKNQKESRRMFFEELEKYIKTPYRLVRVGDCFYASDNGTISPSDQKQDSLDEVEFDFDGEGLNITTDSKGVKSGSNDGEENEQGNDELRQGLGISIETPGDDDTGIVKQEPIRPQLYWLLLIPQAQSVQIYFYSKMQQSVNQSEIIRATKSMVNEVMERTNKMSLLKYLNDTHRCSKYLLDSVEEDKGAYSSFEDSSDEEDFINTGTNSNLVEILSTSGEETTFSPPKKFHPGQFGCDIVYTKRFPLHWRIAPNAAYNKLMSDFSFFLVKNKPGMFVCSHEDAVVYCFLSEVNTATYSGALSDSMNQSLLTINNNGEDGYYGTNPESPYGSSLINGGDNDMLGTSHSRIRHPSNAQNNKPSPQSSITSERQQFSPHQSPSFTDAGVSTTSPITGRKVGSRQQEGRELVLDVYGVEINNYIVDGLVETIESRITSEITLKEVQQFLVRNPNSKLSRADIDFILPVTKKTVVHQKLNIPSIVGNTVQFLKILRKNILAVSSIYAIHSYYLSSTVQRNHDLRYTSFDFNNNKSLEEYDSRYPLEEWSALNLSFYYNYLNRAPGTYLPFEQKIGEGVAGICLSVLSDDDVAYSKITSNSIYNENEKFDLHTLQNCLNSNFNNDCYSKRKVAVDIWTHCKIDAEQIYLYIYNAFRQSICDYIIESALSTIPTIKDNHNSFKKLTKLLLFTLEKAKEWESLTVKYISQPVQLTPWYFDGITLQLRSDLTEIHSSLEPVVGRTELSSNLFNNEDSTVHEEYKLYSLFTNNDDDEHYENQENLLKRLSVRTNIVKSSPLSKKNQQPSQNITLDDNKKPIVDIPIFDNRNFRYLIISGVPELYAKYNLNSRRSSSEFGNTLHMNKPKFGVGSSIGPISEDELHTTHAKNDTIKRDDTISLHSRQESLASSISKTMPGYISKQKSSDLKETVHQHSFIVFRLDSTLLTLFAYNCSESFVDHVYTSTLKNVTQQETRHLGLNNILHQKLGLFHHTSTMVDILSRTAEQEQYIPSPSGLVSSLPLQHNAITQLQISNSNPRSPMSPNIANTIGRLAQLDSTSSLPSIDSSNGDRKSSNKHSQVVADFENLQQLITNNYHYKNRHPRHFRSNSSDKPYQIPSVLDIYDNAKLCKTVNMDGVFTAVRGADANTVLRDVYAESTEDNKNLYDKDYLLRHGEPYLEMYLSRSKPLAAHEKAFKVYTKWADQYYGPGHTKTTDEMMTVGELKLILKASRLLHFCRTPLIFSGSNYAISTELSSSVVGNGFENLFNKSVISKSEEMTAWYERLSRGFMKEYASYLESIGMHLIVYGPSNDQPDEIEAYLSKFTITEDYSVNSPVVYLLQVFEGGSIMCEVRLTGAFVSVTLYTLHRRYGRLQYSPFRIRQRNESVGRKNFQKFMGECDRFKQRVHVNSFVFDFHLRYIQRSLDDVELLPSNLNLLNIIKNTVAAYDRSAIYSRNRIINGIYEFSVDESLSTLVTWIMNNGSNLGLKTLCVDKKPIACFVSSDDLSFEHKSYEFSSENAPFRYTLVICPLEASNNQQLQESISVHRQGSFDMMGSNSVQKMVSHITVTEPNVECSRVISLQYYILVTYRGMDRCTSSDRCQRAWSEVLKDKPKRYENFLDEVLAPETFQMKDVFESAKVKITQIMNKAIYHFNREVDWSRLYEIVHPNLSNETPETLVKLASRFSPIHLGKADPSFDKFLQLKAINWDDALENIKSFYMMTSGEILIRDTRHVLLFIPNAKLPAFFHFVLKPGERCAVTINTKEDRREANVLSNEEKGYITNLATNISYYIWKRLQYTT